MCTSRWPMGFQFCMRVLRLLEVRGAVPATGPNSSLAEPCKRSSLTRSGSSFLHRQQAVRRRNCCTHQHSTYQMLISCYGEAHACISWQKVLSSSEPLLTEQHTGSNGDVTYFISIRFTVVWRTLTVLKRQTCFQTMHACN